MEYSVNMTKGLSFHSKEALWVYLFCFSHIVAVGSTVVPTITKAQDIASGKGFDVNAESAFVVVTASFINACIKAITSKYTTSLSDYTGRKPVLVLSCMMFIFTRICLIFTTSVTGLYILAAIAGTFDSAFPICQAWLCDLLPSKNRSRALSLLIGLGFGLGMAVGLPIGATISQNYTADLAFIVAVILQAVAIFIVCLGPIDNYNIKNDLEIFANETKIEQNEENDDVDSTSSIPISIPTSILKITSDGALCDSCVHVDIEDHAIEIPTNQIIIKRKGMQRRLPHNWLLFLKEQSPSSALTHVFRSLSSKTNVIDTRVTGEIIKKSCCGNGNCSPLATDWCSYLLSQIALKIFQFIIILYLQVLLRTSEMMTAAIVCSIGIAIAIFAPVLLSKFKPLPLYFWGIILFIIGCGMLSVVSLSSIEKKTKWCLVVCSLLLISIGTVWLSAMQSIILNQYKVNVKGETAGVLSLFAEISTVLSYPAGLLFSYTLEPNAKIKWSGIIWMVAIVHLICAACIQILNKPLNDLVILAKRDKKEEAILFYRENLSE